MDTIYSIEYDIRTKYQKPRETESCHRNASATIITERGSMYGREIRLFLIR